MGEYEDDGWGEELAHPVKVRRLDLFILGIDFIRKSAGLIENSLTDLEQMLCQHANYLTQRDEFADQARLEIESLTKEE